MMALVSAPDQQHEQSAHAYREAKERYLQALDDLVEATQGLVGPTGNLALLRADLERQIVDRLPAPVISLRPGPDGAA